MYLLQYILTFYNGYLNYFKIWAIINKGTVIDHYFRAHIHTFLLEYNVECYWVLSDLLDTNRFPKWLS